MPSVHAPAALSQRKPKLQALLAWALLPAAGPVTTPCHRQTLGRAAHCLASPGPCCCWGAGAGAGAGAGPLPSLPPSCGAAAAGLGISACTGCEGAGADAAGAAGAGAAEADAEADSAWGCCCLTALSSSGCEARTSGCRLPASVSSSGWMNTGFLGAGGRSASLMGSTGSALFRDACGAGVGGLFLVREREREKEGLMHGPGWDPVGARCSGRPEGKRVCMGPALLHAVCTFLHTGMHGGWAWMGSGCARIAATLG